MSKRIRFAKRQKCFEVLPAPIISRVFDYLPGATLASSVVTTRKFQELLYGNWVSERSLEAVPNYQPLDTHRYFALVTCIFLSDVPSTFITRERFPALRQLCIGNLAAGNPKITFPLIIETPTLDCLDLSVQYTRIVLRAIGIEDEGPRLLRATTVEVHDTVPVLNYGATEVKWVGCTITVDPRDQANRIEHMKYLRCKFELADTIQDERDVPVPEWWFEYCTLPRISCVTLHVKDCCGWENVERADTLTLLENKEDYGSSGTLRECSVLASLEWWFSRVAILRLGYLTQPLMNSVIEADVFWTGKHPEKLRLVELIPRGVAAITQKRFRDVNECVKIKFI